jgi:hypothetical protein
MPTTPWSAIFAALPGQVQADIKAGAKALREADEAREAARKAKAAAPKRKDK